MNDTFPSLILLHYDKQRWEVTDLLLVHRACITLNCLKPRKPLASSAKRAGWQGYQILLEEIPLQGKIEVITNMKERPKTEVILQWKKTSMLLTKKPELRGWLADTLMCVERCMEVFTSDDVYAFEDELSQKHPANLHIRDKIRQQLQVLRELGLVKFISPGVYQYLGRKQVGY